MFVAVVVCGVSLPCGLSDLGLFGLVAGVPSQRRRRSSVGGGPFAVEQGPDRILVVLVGLRSASVLGDLESPPWCAASSSLTCLTWACRPSNHRRGVELRHLAVGGVVRGVHVCQEWWEM